MRFFAEFVITLEAYVDYVSCTSSVWENRRRLADRFIASVFRCDEFGVALYSRWLGLMRFFVECVITLEAYDDYVSCTSTCFCSSLLRRLNVSCTSAVCIV